MGKQWLNPSMVVTLFLTISIFLPSAKAENKTYPTANQNLSPIELWRSTEFCMENKSSSCQEKYTLNSWGWLNVSHADGPKFCEPGGCADHTRVVLLCLYEVKKDYIFANNATIQDLNDTIISGCNSTQGFTGVSKYRTSHGFRLYSAPIFTAVTIAALLFISYH